MKSNNSVKNLFLKDHPDTKFRFYCVLFVEYFFDFVFGLIKLPFWLLGFIFAVIQFIGDVGFVTFAFITDSIDNIKRKIQLWIMRKLLPEIMPWVIKYKSRRIWRNDV